MNNKWQKTSDINWTKLAEENNSVVIYGKNVDIHLGDIFQKEKSLDYASGIVHSCGPNFVVIRSFNEIVFKFQICDIEKVMVL